MDECMTARRAARCLSRCCLRGRAGGACCGARRLRRGAPVRNGAAAATAPAAVPGFSFVKSAGRHRRIPTRQQRTRRSARGRCLRAGRHVSGDLSRRIAQRGDRHHGSDPYSRAFDVQGQRDTSTIPKATASSSSWSASAGSSTRAPRSTAPTTSPPSAVRTSRATSRSKRIGCAIFGCARPIGRRK